MKRDKKVLLIAALMIVSLITTATSFITYGYKNTNRTRHESYKSDCIFCKIIAGEAEGTILHETDDVIVIDKNHRPSAGLCVDCLIIPKKHIRNIKYLDRNDLTDQTIVSKMSFVAQDLGNKLSGDGGFRNEINNEFGQGIFHMHMHFKSPNTWKK